MTDVLSCRVGDSAGEAGEEGQEAGERGGKAGGRKHRERPDPARPFPVPTGLTNAAVLAAVQIGSPVPMHAIASPLPPVPVMLGVDGFLAAHVSGVVDVFVARCRLLDCAERDSGPNK